MGHDLKKYLIAYEAGNGNILTSICLAKNQEEVIKYFRICDWTSTIIAVTEIEGDWINE